MQPFGNTLVTLSLTGAQIERMLEQQWQSPTLTRILQPSRGFTYSWDPTRAIGDRINPASLQARRGRDRPRDDVPRDRQQLPRRRRRRVHACCARAPTASAARSTSTRWPRTSPRTRRSRPARATGSRRARTAPPPRRRTPSPSPAPGDAAAAATAAAAACRRAGAARSPPLAAARRPRSPAPSADRTAPVISAARLTPGRLALPVRRASQATTIRFRSSERAAVTLTFTRRVRGRSVVDGKLKRSATAGANAIAFRGRVGATAAAAGHVRAAHRRRRRRRQPRAGRDADARAASLGDPRGSS